MNQGLVRWSSDTFGDPILEIIHSANDLGIHPVSVFVLEPLMQVRQCTSILEFTHTPIGDGRLVNFRIGWVLLSFWSGLWDSDIGKFVDRQTASHPPSHVLLPDSLPLLPAGEVALFARHHPPRMDDVEEHKRDEHEC